MDAVVPYLVLQFNTPTLPYSFPLSTRAGNQSVWPSPALRQKLQRNLYLQQGAVLLFPLVLRAEQSNTPHHVVCCYSSNESSCCDTKDWQKVGVFFFLSTHLVKVRAVFLCSRSNPDRPVLPVGAKLWQSLKRMTQRFCFGRLGVYF